MTDEPADGSQRGALAELRRRGVLRVAVLYVVVGYGVIEAADLLFPRIGFADAGVQVLIALVFFCFPVALLISWFARRDERTPAVHPALALAVAAATVGVSGWLGFHVLTGSERRTVPVVVMMDSPLEPRVYDEETLLGGGTNADLVNDILRDLPIVRFKETVSPVWHRDEEIHRLDPDLVLVHLSAFCPEDCERERFRLQRFLEYMVTTRARFVIYSRYPPDTLAMWRDDWGRSVFESFPELERRVGFFSLPAHGSRYWKDPAVAAALKLEVKRILDIE
jgi:hypothetical protein